MADNLLKEALDAFRECEANETENRRDGLDDLRFARLGREHQWPTKVWKDRQAQGRPCITINKMPAFIRQVVNDSRQNKPGISVHPVEKGDQKTAEIIAGLIRNIETISNADIAYDTGVEFSATVGFGYWRVNLDYACDDTFDKDILIKAISNPFSVYGDPYSQGADSSDWNVSFVVDKLTEAQFRRKYPKAKKIDFSSSEWLNAGGWCNREENTVRIAEWWKREEVTRELVQYQRPNSTNVEVGYADDLDRLRQDIGEITVIGQPRPVKSYKVTQRIMNGVEIIDTVEWLGRYIPIVPVYGDEVNVEGKRYFRSLIRDARDPQIMHNFWRTTTAELGALAPKAPFIGKKGSFDADPRWQSANSVPYPYLEYEGDMPPQRQPFSGVPAGAFQEALSAADDIKAVLGIYDASLGARSNETSGKAILARQREGDVSTFHFIDNLSRSIRHTGKILIDLIPKVYNTERVIRVLGQNNRPLVDAKGQPRTIRITDADGDANPDADIYNLTIGKYDLTVEAGASYTTQREEALAMLTEVVRSSPESAAILGDIIVDLMDIPGGDKAVKRLQAMLPEPVKQAEAGEDPNVSAAQQQIQQLQQVIQQGMAKINELQQDKSSDQFKAYVDAYKAATERLKLLAPTFAPEVQIALGLQTLQDVTQTSALVPEGGMPSGNAMPQQGMGPPQEPQGQPFAA